jgi:hypothetical protein
MDRIQDTHANRHSRRDLSADYRFLVPHATECNRVLSMWTLWPPAFGRMVMSSVFGEVVNGNEQGEGSSWLPEHILQEGWRLAPFWK